MDMASSTFNKLNDLIRLSVDFANEVYYFDDSGQQKPPLERTKEIRDHKDRVVGSGVRTYQILCHIYKEQDARELSVLYLTECEGEKFAFIAWKGTNSLQQGIVDLEAKFESYEDWNKQLRGICEGFLSRLPDYLTERGINAAEYEWLTTGHSLGGALAFYSAYLIECDPSIIHGARFLAPITFASMKLPVPLPLPSSADYAVSNDALVFFNHEDALVEFASEEELRRVGRVIVDIDFLASTEKMFHALANYITFFSSRYLVLDPDRPGEYRIVAEDESFAAIQAGWVMVPPLV